MCAQRHAENSKNSYDIVPSSPIYTLFLLTLAPARLLSGVQPVSSTRKLKKSGQCSSSTGQKPETGQGEDRPRPDNISWKQTINRKT